MICTLNKYLFFLLIIFSVNLFAQRIYWVDGVAGELQSVNFEGFDKANLIPDIGAAYGITADLKYNKIYWVDNTAKSIKRADLDGTNIQTIVPQSAGNILIPRGIALNIPGNKIYWTDNGTAKIMSANLDGSNVSTLVSGLDSPGYIVFDSVNQKIYWADNGLSAKKIQRCNTDGTNIQEVVTGLNQVWGIAMDFSGGFIYWIDSGIEKIQKGSLKSSLPVTKIDVDTGMVGFQRGLAVDDYNKKIYWSSTAGKIINVGLDGSNNSIVISGLNYPQGIAIIDSGSTTGINDQNGGSIPYKYLLMQNYPNPFNPSTVIRYQLVSGNFVTIKVYDVLGREITTLVNGFQEAGDHLVSFNGRVASGVYYYVIKAVSLNGKNNFVDTKKMILLK